MARRSETKASLGFNERFKNNDTRTTKKCRRFGHKWRYHNCWTTDEKNANFICVRCSHVRELPIKYGSTALMSFFRSRPVFFVKDKDSKSKRKKKCKFTIMINVILLIMSISIAVFLYIVR